MLTQLLKQVAIELSQGNEVKGWHSFKRHGKPLNAFFNKRIGWVIKEPVYIHDCRTPHSVRVPTIKLNGNWVAQPIVQKVQLKRACDEIKQKLQPFTNIHPDLHVGNVGWFRDEPVMFDW